MELIICFALQNDRQPAREYQAIYSLVSIASAEAIGLTVKILLAHPLSLTTSHTASAPASHASLKRDMRIYSAVKLCEFLEAPCSGHAASARHRYCLESESTCSCEELLIALDL